MRNLETETVQRCEAAVRLRRARAAAPDERREQARLAHEFAPLSHPARRLYVEALLDDGQLATAERLIGEDLLRRPTDAALSLLHARLLYQRGELDEAARELRLAVAARPGHVMTLLLAADVAIALDERHEAARLLERAAACRPGDPEIRQRYISALLAAGEIAQAALELNGLGEHSVALAAQLLHTEGRVDEAACLLESALPAGDGAAATEQLLLELIPLLEELDASARLRAALGFTPADRPDAILRAALAWLGLGEFETAARLAIRLSRWPLHLHRSLHVLVVAAALAERTGLARRALRRLEQDAEGVEASLMAECWRRGLSGRVVAARDTDAWRRQLPSGVLKTMLRHARRVFDQALADGPAEAADQAELARHRAVCLAVLEPIVASEQETAAPAPVSP